MPYRVYYRIQRMSELSKISLVVILVSLVLAGTVGSIVYTATVNSRAGCSATHAVIRNLNDYFSTQEQRIKDATTGYYAQHPVTKRKAIRGYRSVIHALNQVSCH